MKKGNKANKVNKVKKINPYILEEITKASMRGVMVQVEGNYYNTCNFQEIPLLREEEIYMKDYIGDEKGNIIEIILNRIKMKND